MALDPSTLVQPTDPNSVPDDAQTAPEAAPAIPDEVLKIPAMSALFAGQPGALSFNLKTFGKTEVGKDLSENKEVLGQAGIGLYKSLSGDVGVVFNATKVHPQDLQAADKAGQLLKIAPPFDAINHAVSKMG